MTKKELIYQYNLYVDELNDIMDDYNKLCGYSSRGFREYLKESTSKSKDEISDEIECITKSIATFNEKVKSIINNKEFKKTDTGKMFIDELNQKKSEIESEYKKLSDTIHQDINGLLSEVGLTDWRVHSIQDIIPSYDTVWIHLDNDKHKCNIRLVIDKNYNGNTSHRLYVSCGLEGSGYVSSPGEDYHKFKAYVTIYDNPELFSGYVNGKYKELCHQAYDLGHKYEELEKASKQPYEAWCEQNFEP